tara:strand:- start:738 stop:1502 length:765 start_codon:yes stop_codon:yes gene_type:complete
MSYEESISYEELECIDYHKYKIATLLTSFIRNNQQICNFHHGDLHKGNWKVRLCEDNKYKLVIYDFGFCWKVPHDKIDEIENSIYIFENTEDDENNVDYDRMTNLLLYLMKYDSVDKEKYRDVFNQYLRNNTHLIRPWALNPSRIFKVSVKLCNETGLKIDPLLIQAVIILIQCQKIFQEFRFISDDKNNYISPTEVHREKYMDWLSFYKTYNIFYEFSLLVKDRLNDIQTEVNNIFDTNDKFNTFKSLALKYK